MRKINEKKQKGGYKSRKSNRDTAFCLRKCTEIRLSGASWRLESRLCNQNVIYFKKKEAKSAYFLIYVKIMGENMLKNTFSLVC